MEDALVVVDAAMEGEMNCRNATPNATRITRSAARCMRCEDMGTKRTCAGATLSWVLLHATSRRHTRAEHAHALPYYMYNCTWYPYYGRSCAPKRGI